MCRIYGTSQICVYKRLKSGSQATIAAKGEKMANRKFWLGMLVLALVFGMTVVGCGGDEGDDDEPDPHKITITGLGGKTGYCAILLYSYFSEDGDGVVAGWQGTISGNSVTASLQKAGGGAWTGSGQYLISIQIGEDDDMEAFVYTNGKTLDELGIETDNDLYTKLPKYNITGSTTTISFDKFFDVTGI